MIQPIFRGHSERMRYPSKIPLAAENPKIIRYAEEVVLIADRERNQQELLEKVVNKGQNIN